MKSLFAIQGDLMKIFNALEENDGELTPELEEALNISQEEFTTKVIGYVNVLKTIDADLAAIKEEKTRLDNLKKSKERVASNLKTILANAINQFGDTNKSGNKYFDYGTGTITIRKSDSVEVNEDITKEAIDKIMQWMAWRVYDTSIDTLSDKDYEDLVNYCNKWDDEKSTPLNITKDDIDNLQADITIRLNLKDMLNNSKQNEFIKQLFKFNTATSNKPAVDKMSIKSEVKNTGFIPTFATYTVKDNIVIK